MAEKTPKKPNIKMTPRLRFGREFHNLPNLQNEEQEEAMLVDLTEDSDPSASEV